MDVKMYLPWFDISSLIFLKYFEIKLEQGIDPPGRISELPGDNEESGKNEFLYKTIFKQNHFLLTIMDSWSFNVSRNAFIISWY